MGKIIKKRIEYGGSSNSAENIKYDDTKNVKEAIAEVKSEIANVNSNFKWKSLYTNISDSNAHSLPDGWSELMIIMQNSDGYNASTNVNTLYVSGAVKSYSLSGYGAFDVSASSITKTSGSYMTVYYR